MEVLHLITTIDRGGAENQLLFLASHQVEAGMKVYVSYLKGSGELTEDFNKAKVDIIPLKADSRIRNFFKIRQLLRTQPSLLVHAHLPMSELLSIFLLVRTKNSLIVSRHNCESFVPGLPGKISVFLSRLVIRRASAVVAISNTVKKFILETGEVPKESLRKVRVIYYGIPEFTSKNTNTIRRGAIGRSEVFKIAVLARLVPQKNLLILPEIFQMLPKHCNFEVNIYGEGILRTEISEKIFQYRQMDRIFLRGKTLNALEILESSQMLLLTSRYEGLGLVLLEAMSASCPIVASDLEITREILGDDYPFLAKLNDPSDFARKIQCIIENPQTSFSERYSTQLTQFTAAACLDKHRALYHEILN